MPCKVTHCTGQISANAMQASSACSLMSGNVKVMSPFITAGCGLGFGVKVWTETEIWC